MNRIFFSSDLHIGHENVLKFMPNRLCASSNDVCAHDARLIELWRETIGRHDRIYLGGDITFYKSEDARRLLEKLPGEKYIAWGNHDQSIKSHHNYFRRATDIMEVVIKPTVCDLLSEPLHIVLCHYPLLDWPGKYQGSVMLHGHCHGTMDDYNAQSVDLRFDIGFDAALATQVGGFISIETLYHAIMSKTQNLSTAQYAAERY